MISSNATEVTGSIAEYKKDLELRLKAMVAGFAGDVATAASKSTAVGDENKFFSLYKQRQLLTGIDPIRGFHQGAWVYSEGGLSFDPTIYSPEQASAEVEDQAQSSYKVGDSFTIGAVGTAYEMLQERDDIIGSAEELIARVYQSDLKQHFDGGYNGIN